MGWSSVNSFKIEMLMNCARNGWWGNKPQFLPSHFCLLEETYSVDFNCIRTWNIKLLASLDRMWRKGRGIHPFNPEHQLVGISWRVEELWSSQPFVLFFWSSWNLNYFWKFELIVGLTTVHIFWVSALNFILTWFHSS